MNAWKKIEMSKADEKCDIVLDFRHENGVNRYLVKEKRSGEIKWIPEADLPKGVDSSLRTARLRKGEYARRRVFGHGMQSVLKRVIQFNDSKPSIDSLSQESSSSESERSSDSDDQLKSSHGSANKDMSAESQNRGPLGASKSQLTQILISSFINRVSCRNIRLPTDAHVRLNSLFHNLLYVKGVVSEWHRKILDLLWCLIITSEDSIDRDSALEQLCLLVSRLNAHDSIVSKSIDELLDESVIDELDSAKFDIILRICDLLKNASIEKADLNNDDTAMAEVEKDVTVKNTRKSNAYKSPRFSYVNPGEVELDDDGIIQLVYKIYETKNREKLGDVPGIIEKYRSQLSVLFTTLMRKYGVMYHELNDKRVFVPVDVKGQKLKERLTEIFSTFEPSRLVDVDEIVSRFLGRPSDDVADYIESLEENYMHSFGDLRDETNNPSVTDMTLFGFRGLIEEAIAIGNPERLPRIDQLLRKYRGREQFLYLAVCDKYDIPINEERFKAALQLREESVEKDRKTRMRDVLTGVYEKYNKAKLAEVDKLVDKFNVLELFDLVAKKYGISLDEKINLLLSTGVHTEVDVDFTPLVTRTVHALALAVELDRKNKFLSEKPLPGEILKLLKNPLTHLSITSAEMIIQAKSGLFLSHGPSGSIAGGAQVEGLLRDLIETKVTDVLKSLPTSSSLVVQVTAQEPEYLMPDSFLAAESGRCSCVVSLKGDSSEITRVVNGITEKMASFELKQPTGAGVIQPVHDESGIVTGPGAFRCFSILRSSSSDSTVLCGEYRALQGPNDCLSLFRSRISVFTSSGEDLVARLLQDCKWTDKCLVVISHGKVTVVGSQKHRVAFNRAVDRISRLTGQSEPDYSVTVPRRLCPSGKPGMVLPPQINDWSDVTYHESGDDQFVEDGEPSSETVRPLRLTRQTMRDSYLQGQLCLNCDETTHKPPECPIKRKVCWNCHGAHAGASCVLPCRFCKGRHSWGILECVKRGAKRYVDWLKSRSYAEEKGLGAMVDDVIGRLRTNGWNTSDSSVAGSIKSLNQLGVFVELYVELAKLEDADSLGGLGASGAFMEGGIKPVPPKEPAPPLPDSKYAWYERLWLDEILSPELIGRDPMKLIMAQKGSAIKKLESEENCKIAFKGTSAKEIFSGAAGTDPAIDVRFHAVIMTNTPYEALTIKKLLREMLSDIHQQVAEGSVARPPVVEGFSFYEKISSLNENIAQFDFMNANSGAPIEIELKNHFEYIGDLRHWLHQKGVEVELGDDDSVKLPSTGKVIETIDSANRPNVDAKYIDIFNAFFELVSFWTNAPPSCGGPYWFEPYELRPAGLLGLADYGYEHAQFENGQVVHLSDKGVDHFTDLLIKAGFLSVEENEIRSVLAGLKGVVRTNARDNRLLMYLKHPWAMSSSTGTVARDVPEDFESVKTFSSVLNPIELRACGRLGHSSVDAEIVSNDIEVIRKMLAPYNDESSGDQGDVSTLIPGEGLLKRLSLETSVPESELPYVGYIVDWVTPQEVTDFVSGFSAMDMDTTEVAISEEVPVVPEETVVVPPQPPVLPAEEDLNSLTVNELRDRLKAKDLPTTGRKADLIERIRADLTALKSENEPTQSYMCRVELPRALMAWSELSNNLSGPGNAHFAHIKQMCPTANITCVGTAAAALVGEARLHVQLTASSLDDYHKARSLVEDLVKAVVEVGSEICLPDDPTASQDAVLKEVRIVEVSKK